MRLKILLLTCLLTYCLYLRVQTITGAMSTINPPVELAEPDNQFRLEYIQETASQIGFDYPPVYRQLYLLLGCVSTCAALRVALQAPASAR